MKKEYSNGEVTIIWQPEKCIHSAVCVKGLPDVFKPREKPWINPEAASTDQLVEQVKKCPSGALTFRMNNNEPTDVSMDTASLEIQVIPNGPYLVNGKITIAHADGTKEQKDSTTAFCRCGASSTKPFCDGSHRKNGFVG